MRPRHGLSIMRSVPRCPLGTSHATSKRAVFRPMWIRGQYCRANPRAADPLDRAVAVVAGLRRHLTVAIEYGPSMTRAAVRTLDRRLSVAPMMDWTDRHCRYFHRLLAPGALLYTEMVHTGAVLHGDVRAPSGLRRRRTSGGAPARRQRAGRAGARRPHWRRMGYDEINLNCGCPSDRVQRGRFGACLMAEPERVADVRGGDGRSGDRPRDGQMPDRHRRQRGVRLPAPLRRHRPAGGCDTFIVHARKAWLNGLSPKENREIPPLRYEIVHRLKRDFPSSQIVLNGGLRRPRRRSDAARVASTA